MVSKFDIIALSGVSAGDIFHFQIDDTASISIGRATECDLVLQDPMVSRRHLTIEKRSDGFFIVDQGSTHGTFHMGFHLKSGPEGARHVHDGDEFKIGDMLFRMSFDETEFAPKKAEKKKDDANRTIIGKRVAGPLTKKPVLILSVVALAALGFLFFPAEKGGLPPQKGGEVISVPSFGVIGYFNSPETANRKGEKDFAHLDKAQFDIPVSDVLIEFEYSAESTIDVRLDDVSIGKLLPNSLWELRHFIIRGVANGKQRRLIFDNLDFPKKEGSAEKPKRWAVRDVRATPLTRSYGVEPGFENQISSAIGLVEGIDKSPDGMFILIRALQTATVELLKELKIDAAFYAVNPGADDVSQISDISQLELRLDVLRKSWTQSAGEGGGVGTLRELTNVVGGLDAELWRRINNRIMQARQEARVKNYIGAHDALMSGMKMFPAEADYRWTLLDRLYLNKKIVPKRVREDPGNFRK